MARQVGDSPTAEARIMSPEKLAKLDKRISSRESEIAASRQDIGDAIARAEASDNCVKWSLKVYRQWVKRPEVAVERWVHLKAYIESRKDILEPAQVDIETAEERQARAEKAAGNVTRLQAG